jgi:recombinational DNA repair protein RecT
MIKVLTSEEIGYYRGFSKAKSGPWIDNYPGMARKTAIKRAAALVPGSPLMAAALKENEVGGYEIPEEMWEQAKQRATGGVSEQVPADLTPEDADLAAARAIDQGRQPGSDG